MLEAQLQALFELYGEKMVQDMRTKMAEKTKTYRSVASGLGSASLEAVADGNSLSILGNSYIEQVSEGRPPGFAGRGDQSDVAKKIADWVRIKGIQPNKDSIRYKDLPFLMVRKIKAEGYVGINLFQYVIDKNIVPLSEDVADLVLEVLGEQLDQTITANFAGGKMGTAI